MSVPQKSTRFTRLSRARATLVAAAVGAGLVAGATTACSAGQVSQTANQQAAVNGAQGFVGTIALRDVMLNFPSANSTKQFVNGHTVDMSFILSNTSSYRDDRLISVTPAPGTAGSVTINGNNAIPASKALRAGEPPLLLTPSTQPLDPQEKRISVEFSDGQRRLTPGLNVPLTFTFQNSGQITLPVPIVAATNKPRQA